MSKVICDVCGTSYPDTATQCPICGYVRTTSTQSDASQADTKEGYTYVKGGRFSKANVKKRNGANGAVTANIVRDKKKKPKNESGGSGNKGLLITVLVLLILIVSVVLYITFRHIIFNDVDVNEGNNAPTSDFTSDDEQEESEDQAKQFMFEKTQITMTKVDETQTLYITPLPATADQLTVSSSNKKVATAVLDDGVVRVTAVGPGEAVISLTSGSFTDECKVFCDIEKEIKLRGNLELKSVDATEDLLLNRDEFTEEELAEMEWTTSAEKIAHVENGVVTVRGEGEAEITVEYRGKTQTLTVKCSIQEDGTSTGDAELDFSVSAGTGGVSES